MLLYFQPIHIADQRRCFMTGAAGQRGGDFLDNHTETASLGSLPEEEAGAVCVHQSPTVTSIYLVLE
jgi:hypothetical protein